MKKYLCLLCSGIIVLGLAVNASALVIDFTDVAWSGATGATTYKVGDITVNALGATGNEIQEFVLAWDSTYGLGIVTKDTLSGAIIEPDAQIDGKENLEILFASPVKTDVYTSVEITRMSDDYYPGKPTTNKSLYLNDAGVLDTYLGFGDDKKPTPTPNASRVNFDLDDLNIVVYDISIMVALPTFKSNPIEFERIIFASTDNNYGDGFMVGGIEGTGVAPVPEPTTLLLLGSGLVCLALFGRKKFFKK